jgi:hypothetical protein
MNLAIKGVPEKGGIPRGASIYVYRHVAEGRKQPVYEVKFVPAGPRNIEVEPGRYSIVIAHFPPGRRKGLKYVYEEYVGVTPEAWERLSGMAPSLMRVMSTSEGVVYACREFGCNQSFTSEVAALVHEYEHFGIDVLGGQVPPDTVEEAREAKAASMPAQDKKALAAARTAIRAAAVQDGGARPPQVTVPGLGTFTPAPPGKVE